MMNELDIRKWWDIFKKNGNLTEIRILDGKRTYSGYFKNIDNIISAIKPFESANIYFTLNCIDESCYGREQNERLIMNPKNTTSDSDIIARDFIMVDIDPKRVAGTNATNQELERAHLKAVDIYRFLKDNGFNEPIIAMSGNGWHIHIPVALKASQENTDLVKRFLLSLAKIFTDKYCDIDLKVFNNSRICKLFGTRSNKGADIEDRPKRYSYIVKVPDEIKINHIDYIKKIADMFPEQEETRTAYNDYDTKKFDLDEFISKHHIQVSQKIDVADGTRYILDHCLFNDAHRGKDAMIFKANNGVISYFCFHNSCSQYRWKDVRIMFEPDAYTRKDYEQYQQKKLYYGNYKRESFTPLKETSDKGKKWLSMKDIKYIDLSTLVAIPTGYEVLDKKIVGLMLGDITVFSGLSGGGKSSWIDCLSLNVIQRGFKVAIWSGELQDFRFQNWINQIAAGKSYVRKREGYDNYYYAPKNVCEKINEWTDDKLFLYNNQYGSKWQQLFNDIKNIVDEKAVQLVILDNLMALQIDSYEGDKYSQQTKFINDLKEYAKLKNVHILLVCHPRKESSNQLLRKESISGTADLTNMADNCFIIHRIGMDFEKKATEFFGATKAQDFMCYSAVLEVAKNRSLGVVDELIGMYYEPESRRLKNTIDEHIIYGWQESPIQQELPQLNEFDNNDFENSTEIEDCPF